MDAGCPRRSRHPDSIAAQRRALGLLTDEAPIIAADAPVVPFLAIQRGMKPVYRERLAAMHEHLRASGVTEAVHRGALLGRGQAASRG